jgi:hypothetical protein
MSEPVKPDYLRNGLSWYRKCAVASFIESSWGKSGNGLPNPIPLSFHRG